MLTVYYIQLFDLDGNRYLLQALSMQVKLTFGPKRHKSFLTWLCQLSSPAQLLTAPRYPPHLYGFNAAIRGRKSEGDRANSLFLLSLLSHQKVVSRLIGFPVKDKRSADS